MSDTRSSPSPFPSSLVADPAEEAFKELSSEVVVALDRVLAHVDAVPSNKTWWLAITLDKPNLSPLLPVPVVLHPVKAFLRLGAVPSLP